MKKKVFQYTAYAALFMLLGVLIALVINPGFRYDQELPPPKLRLFADNSISFYDRKPRLKNFETKLKQAWEHEIEVIPFAASLGESFLLSESSLSDLEFLERRTLFAPLLEQLRFSSVEEPVVLLSDFIFRDFFDAQFAVNSVSSRSATPVQNRFFVTLAPPNSAKTDLAIFIENDNFNSLPSASLAAKDKDLKNTLAAQGEDERGNFELRLSTFVANPPQQALLTISQLELSGAGKLKKKVLLSKKVELNSRVQSFIVEPRVPLQKQLSLESKLSLLSGEKIEASDSANFSSAHSRIPIAAFSFAPFEDVALIKRTLQRYRLFAIRSYFFLRPKASWKLSLGEVLEKYKREETKKSAEEKTVFLLFGGDEETIDIFRGYGFPLIIVPKITLKEKDSQVLDTQRIDVTWPFLNLLGEGQRSREEWQRAARYVRTLSKDLEKKDLPYYTQSAQSKQSFLFLRGQELYVGLNGFRELNSSYVASAGASRADVFWVKLLQTFYSERIAKNEKASLHNYFLGQPVSDSQLGLGLKKLVNTEAGSLLTKAVSPLLESSGFYPLAKKARSFVPFYHYRIDLSEYYASYVLEPALLSEEPELFSKLATFSKEYQQKTLSYELPLRSFYQPYIALLFLFLVYLLAKFFYTREESSE